MDTTPERLHGFHDAHPPVDDFRADVLDGLTRPDQKVLFPKYLYDTAGSHLFDRICGLPEYYPTRTEMAILRERLPAIREAVADADTLVEIGSGSTAKIRLMLDGLDRLRRYVPVDISRGHLVESARSLAVDHPDLEVLPVCADFTRLDTVPRDLLRGRPMAFFPGSTIGNFEPGDAVQLLAACAAFIGTGARLVIGADLVKDREVLRRAYDDSLGVTAAFNRNLLARIQRELGGDLDPDAFAHEARWNAARSRIEMHLVATRPVTAQVAGQRITVAEGESIHTESSHKFTLRGFQDLAAEGGFRPVDCWTDPEDLFSVHLLEVG